MALGVGRVIWRLVHVRSTELDLGAVGLGGIRRLVAIGRGDSETAAEKDAPELQDPDGFLRYVEAVRAEALEETHRADGWVPATHLWFVEHDVWLGRLTIRHRLTPRLLTRSGHIGYDIRPSRRRRGHATAMLREAIPIARDLGIASALVTCNISNIASRKVVEANGGAFEDERYGRLRYWIRTGTT